jgi:hypothetical protein
MNYQSIGKEKAIALFESKWWERGLASKHIAMFQLSIDELCMPFDLFHKAIEKALGRPVYTHEFGLNRDNLILELIGEKDAPTLQEILNLIPEEKRIVIEL